MKILHTLSMGFVGLAIASSIHLVAAAAQTAKDLVGTWSLVSVTYEQNGKTIQPYGANPKGIEIFGSDARVVLIILNSELPNIASNNRVEGTAEENKAVVQGSLAYFGSYTASDTDKSFSVQIEGATFPNWTGASQERTFVIKGDELTITNPRSSTGLPSTVVWKRVK
jgi:hypothetical protein